ncbi:P-loop containing nucleoside triphosphate hydrolase protein [Chaetomidium leptoderma]|uniref:P-loop containing nucleoside triphosphate hydrolase protein n=1 Tax=Chaetomidium leptoderma TaxID=669021 RepID=A0AAN6VRY3_9PEZI|nr:P-loop containing nucleoside triphosphate hydrolase protein [Chaetomidium leptoderma]
MSSGEPSNKGSAQAPASQKSPKFVTWFKDCEVLAGSHPADPVIAGLNTKIRARLIAFKSPHNDPWLGCSLDFPLPQNQAVNEDAGLGVRYNLARAVAGGTGVVQSEFYTLSLRFPRGQVTVTIEDPTPAVVKRFAGPGAKQLAMVTVELAEGARVRVDGFGMPFRNPEDEEVDGWINDNRPTVQNITLLDFLRRRVFHFAVPMSAAIDGVEDLGRYERLLEQTKSAEQFRPAFGFDDDNSHVAVVSQSVVQDIFWLYQAGCAIEAIRFPAYLVDRGNNRYCIIVALTKDFADTYEAAWRRLASDGEVKLRFHDEVEGLDCPIWNCTIVEHPDSIDQLAVNHPTEEYELCLRFDTSPLGAEDAINFEPKHCVSLIFPVDLDDARRKVESACLFLPGAAPTHTLPVQLGPEEPVGQDDRMELHRAIMRGKGFYDWMTRPAVKDDIVQAMASVPTGQPAPVPAFVRPLPVVNLLAVQDQRYVDALLEEALPADRAPFREYLRHRTLGVGILIAAPGFGKTTLLSVAGLAMQASLGSILSSGPSNVAVDNLARRLDRISQSVCARYNRGKGQDDQTRARHRLVIRGYNKDREIEAFMSLLKDPRFTPVARGKERKNPWQLQLSVAYWSLVILGAQSDRIPALQPDDSKGLHDLRVEINQHDSLRNLRAVATRQMAWQEFVQVEGINSLVQNDISSLMTKIVGIADILCTTPAQAVSDHGDYSRWAQRNARGVLVDEAANMHRADIGCVWGNALLPCFLGGDPQQLSPTITTGREADSDGNFYNRLANDGAISPLTFLQVSGLPVCRLRQQLRIADALFDWVAKELYNEINFTYAASCAIDQPQFRAGHMLEHIAQSRFGVRPPPPGKLLPLFVHCEGARVYVDQRTGSKRSPKQVQVALDIALDLVMAGVRPSQITILSPYAANLGVAARLRKSPRYVPLLKMGPASTVDSYQGQENDIIIVIMGTSFPQPGPGFTADPHRLNVLLTRQRCGLVLVGDVHIRGPPKNAEAGQAAAQGGGGQGPHQGEGKGKGKGNAKRFLVVSPTGERSWVAAPMLQHIYSSMIDNGRVITVDVRDM